jgi:uncharacterized protein YndB with AHSA1/START domain
MKDLMDELDKVRRGVDGHVVELRRTYAAPPEAVWDACTNPERIPRWFLPVSGDLRPGGRYQLEGNAGGEIRECDPPRRLHLTWVFGEQSSLVTLELVPAAEGTELTLTHEVPDDDHWARFGPGAVGVGWELGLIGLAFHIGGSDPDKDAPPPAEFMRASAAAWGEVHDDPAAAGMAARTGAAYAP